MTALKRWVLSLTITLSFFLTLTFSNSLFLTLNLSSFLSYDSFLSFSQHVCHSLSLHFSLHPFHSLCSSLSLSHLLFLSLSFSFALTNNFRCCKNALKSFHLTQTNSNAALWRYDYSDPRPRPERPKSPPCPHVWESHETIDALYKLLDTVGCRLAVIFKFFVELGSGCHRSLHLWNPFISTRSARSQYCSPTKQ